jgi:hypothetical protein
MRTERDGYDRLNAELVIKTVRRLGDEDLTTGLSRKIWQKLIILQHYAPEATKQGAGAAPLSPPEKV